LQQTLVLVSKAKARARDAFTVFSTAEFGLEQEGSDAGATTEIFLAELGKAPGSLDRI